VKPKNKSILIGRHKIEEDMRNNLVSLGQSIAKYLEKPMQISKSRMSSLKMKRSKLSSMLKSLWKCRNLWLSWLEYHENKRITNQPNKVKLRLKMETKRLSRKRPTRLNKSMKKSIPNPNKLKQTKQKITLSNNPWERRSNKGQLK